MGRFKFWVWKILMLNNLICRNPTPTRQWLPVTPGKTNFMDILNDGTEPGLDPYGERFAFWTGLFEKYGKLVEPKA